MKKQKTPSSVDDFFGESIEDGSMLNPTPLTHIYTKDDSFTSAHNEAKTIIFSITKEFFTEDSLINNGYLRVECASKVDILKELLVSLSQITHLITNAVITSDSGDFTPQMFQGISILKKTKLDILKSIALFKKDVYEEMRKYKQEQDVILIEPTYENEQNKEIKMINDKKNVFRGGREMILKLNKS